MIHVAPALSRTSRPSARLLFKQHNYIRHRRECACPFMTRSPAARGALPLISHRVSSPCPPASYRECRCPGHKPRPAGHHRRHHFSSLESLGDEHRLYSVARHAVARSATRSGLQGRWARRLSLRLHPLWHCCASVVRMSPDHAMVCLPHRPADIQPEPASPGGPQSQHARRRCDTSRRGSRLATSRDDGSLDGSKERARSTWLILPHGRMYPALVAPFLGRKQP